MVEPSANRAGHPEEYAALWRESNALYEAWAKQHGLTYLELLVALSLVQGVCTQREICRHWVLPKQTVNTVLKSFYRRAWVMLTPMQQDKRNKAIVLTPDGQEHLQGLCAELHRLECAVWERLGKEQARALIENTVRYNRQFKEVTAIEAKHDKTQDP